MLKHFNHFSSTFFVFVPISAVWNRCSWNTNQTSQFFVKLIGIHQYLAVNSISLAIFLSFGIQCLYDLDVEVREHLPVPKKLSFESPDCSYTCLRLSLLNSGITSSFIAPLPLTTVACQIKFQNSIDEALSLHSSANNCVRRLQCPSYELQSLVPPTQTFAARTRMQRSRSQITYIHSVFHL